MDDHSRKQVERIVLELSDAEQLLLSRVIEAEQAKIYMKSPQGIVEDLRKAVEETVRG
jgi:hypothetical protein